MSRPLAFALAALIATTPLSVAAQERAPRGGRDAQIRDERPRISQAEAQGIAQARAGDARFVGYVGYRNGRYIYRFERDGRIIDISVDAQTGR